MAGLIHSPVRKVGALVHEGDIDALKGFPGKGDSSGFDIAA